MSPYPQQKRSPYGSPYGQKQQARASYYNQRYYNYNYGTAQKKAAAPVDYSAKAGLDKSRKMKYIYAGLGVFIIIGIAALGSLFLGGGGGKIDPALESELDSRENVDVAVICSRACSTDFIKEDLNGRIIVDWEEGHERENELIIEIKGTKIKELSEQDWVYQLVEP